MITTKEQILELFDSADTKLTLNQVCLLVGDNNNRPFQRKIASTLSNMVRSKDLQIDPLANTKTNLYRKYC